MKKPECFVLSRTGRAPRSGAETRERAGEAGAGLLCARCQPQEVLVSSCVAPTGMGRWRLPVQTL